MDDAERRALRRLINEVLPLLLPPGKRYAIDAELALLWPLAFNRPWPYPQPKTGG